MQWRVNTGLGRGDALQLVACALQGLKAMKATDSSRCRPSLLESQPSWAVNIGSRLVRVEAVCGGGVLRMSCGGSSQASMASSSLLSILEKLLASPRARGSWVLCRLGMWERSASTVDRMAVSCSSSGGPAGEASHVSSFPSQKWGFLIPAVSWSLLHGSCVRQSLFRQV